MDTYLTRVSEDQLLNEPGLQPLRRDLLELALNYYEKFAEERGEDVELQLYYADALDRAANIREILGLNESLGMDLLLEANEIRRHLFERDRNNDEYRNALAESHRLIGPRLRQKHAVERLEKAVEIARPLTTPDHRLTLARAYADLGETLIRHRTANSDEIETAHGALTEAIHILEELDGSTVAEGAPVRLPQVHELMAELYNMIGNEPGEEQSRNRAIELLNRLAKADPDDTRVQESLARSYWNAGLYERALDIDKKLATENPHVFVFQIELAASYGRLAMLRRSDDDLDQAIDFAKLSVESMRRTAEEFPERAASKAYLGQEEQRLAHFLLEAGKIDEAIGRSESAIRNLTEASAFPRARLAAYSFLSSAYERAGRLNEAIEAGRNGLRETESQRETYPDHRFEIRISAAGLHKDLGDLLAQSRTLR